MRTAITCCDFARVVARSRHLHFHVAEGGGFQVELQNILCLFFSLISGFKQVKKCIFYIKKIKICTVPIRLYSSLIVEIKFETVNWKILKFSFCRLLRLSA